MDFQILTANAGHDSLTEQDYLDMLSEALETYTLRQLVNVLKSKYSHSQWSMISKGERGLSRTAKNELRRHFKLPPLPPTVQEAVAVADENSEVRRTGKEVPNLVWLMNHARAVAIVNPASGTGVTRATSRKAPSRIADMPQRALAAAIRERVEL